MTISIIGANGNNLTIVVEDKLSNKLDDINLEYSLLKEKYRVECESDIIDKTYYIHFLNQLMNLFNHDISELNKFILYINEKNNNDNLNQHIKIIIDNSKILDNLNNIIKLINIKLKIKNDKNLYKNISYIIKILKKNKSSDINNLIKNIENNLISLNSKLNEIKNIKLRKKDIIISSDIILYSKKLISDILKSLDNVIEINSIIQKNITTLENNLNNIIDNLTKLYNII